MNTPPPKRKKATSATPSNSEAAVNSDNPATATITVTAVEVPELTEEEQSDRLNLERKVERAFFEAGKALAELRDRKLYRSTHKTFEEYCKQRFGYTRIAASYKIAAATVMDNLLTNGLQKEEIATDELQTSKMLTNGLQILPNNERQVRPLVSLEPQVQIEAWQQAVEEAGGKVPSGRIVKGVVERFKDKPLFFAHDFCQIGDVFTICKLEGTERKYNGCWAIAVALNEFTVEVDVHDATITVKPDNLNKIDSPEAHRQLPQIKKRILRLRECGMLDRCAYTVLESLGRQTYLTAVEDGLLQWLEKHYGVSSIED